MNNTDKLKDATADKDIPAFPCEWDYIGSNRAAANGMTLRDYFAAKAMQAIVQSAFSTPEKVRAISKGDVTELVVSKQAYFFADAMLEARKS